MAVFIVTPYLLRYILPDGLGKFFFNFYPFCDDAKYSLNSLRTHCYQGIDLSIAFILYISTIATLAIIFLRIVKNIFGKRLYTFSFLGILFLLIGFFLLGITPLIFFFGFILLISPFIFFLFSDSFQKIKLIIHDHSKK